jgi:type I restriction enzyme M protein
MANKTLRLELGTLESWLWEAACKIRGEIDAPKYKDYILLLISLGTIKTTSIGEGDSPFSCR